MTERINGQLVEFLDRDCLDLQQNALFIQMFGTKGLKRIYEDYFLSDEKNGVELTLRDEVIVKAIRLTQAYENSKYCELDTLLAKPVSYVFSKQNIVDLFGQPYKQGGGQKDSFFKDGIVPYWTKYLYLNGTCHFQYTSDMKKIELITLGSRTMEAT